MIMTVIISVVVKTFFRSRDEDRDLGLQVSTRLRPWPSGLETETKTWTEWTRVSRPWSRDHNTGHYQSYHVISFV